MGNHERQALTGVDAGQVLSFESCATGVPTVSLFAEGNTGSGVTASGCPAPRSQRPCTCVPILHARNLGGPASLCGVVTRSAVGEGEEPNGLHVRWGEVGQTRRSEEADEQR